jgi:hypothetical protein
VYPNLDRPLLTQQTHPLPLSPWLPLQSPLNNFDRCLVRIPSVVLITTSQCLTVQSSKSNHAADEPLLALKMPLISSRFVSCACVFASPLSSAYIAIQRPAGHQRKRSIVGPAHGKPRNSNSEPRLPRKSTQMKDLGREPVKGGRKGTAAAGRNLPFLEHFQYFFSCSAMYCLAVLGIILFYPPYKCKWRHQRSPFCTFACVVDCDRLGLFIIKRIETSMS